MVLLLIGTNDISAGASDEAILGDLDLLLGSLQCRLPDASVVVQSPHRADGPVGQTHRGAEHRIPQRATACSAEYLGLHPALATADGLLRPKFTMDGLHLTGPGYAAWVRVLRNALDAA